MRTIDLPAALERFPLLRDFATAARDADACVWLVGGVVRDALLGRETRDADLVTDGDPAKIATSVGRAARATVVHLYDDPPTYRVVHGGIEYDLTRLRDETLDGDLRARDLTINALAARLGGDGEVIDETGGLGDLDARVVRGTSLASFEADPLRALRVYRFAAELAFDIDRETRTWCTRVGGALRGVARERIWEETRRLLATPRSARALRMAFDDGVLAEVFFVVDLDFDVAMHVVGRLERDGAIHEKTKNAFDDAVTLKLAALDQRRGTSAIADNLNAPKSIRRAVEAIVDHRDAPARMRARIAGGEDERGALADYWMETGEAWLAVARLDMAEQLANGEAGAEEWLARLRAAHREFVEPVLASPLVTGHDLMNELGVPKGPQIGRALAGITRERIAGTIRTREEAMAFAREIFRTSTK
ncbi:MAG: CCA tRNA nucleotidyltransferase [Deltaproteobacteria bacterium]|nr:CCA tRNA nucleotidyltransferase [Deltaproteobacteria bacterium]